MPDIKKTKRFIRKAFTLVELIVVVVVVGILASLAMPRFIKSMEMTKGKEGNVAMDQIWAAEKIYRSQEGFFYPKSVATQGTVATINSFLRTDLNETNWDLSVTSNADNTFTATATRSGGPNNGETLTIDQNKTLGGTFSP